MAEEAEDTSTTTAAAEATAAQAATTAAAEATAAQAATTAAAAADTAAAQAATVAEQKAEAEATANEKAEAVSTADVTAKTAATEKDQMKSTIHGRQVTTNADDKGSRQYLRALDPDEAKTIFNQAKVKGSAEYEARQKGVRHNYSAGYKGGRYTITPEGKQEIPGS